MVQKVQKVPGRTRAYDIFAIRTLSAGARHAGLTLLSPPRPLKAGW